MTRIYFSTEHRARWRWLLYVALALAGGLLTFAGARAQQRDDRTLRQAPAAAELAGLRHPLLRARIVAARGLR